MSKQGNMTLGFSLTALPLALRAENMYRRLPELRLSAWARELPPLSIIIPARNEAQNLRRLLPSLNNQIYPGPLELIVVDDHSTDETAVVAREFGARVIAAPPLPRGWQGKTNASHYGASVARGGDGEWFLFTDADTSHAPLSAASAVAYAQAHRLDGLSVFLQQVTRGWLDRAVLMVAFAGLFAGMRASTPLLNGQYLLISRAAYEQSGGFAAVRAEMLEDLAFGRHLSDNGFFVPMMRGETLARVYMYVDWRQLWQGITRLGSGSIRWTGLGSLLAVVFITAVMMPVWVLLFKPEQLREHPRLWWLWLTSMGGFIPWGRRFGKTSSALLAPVGAAIVQVSAIWGIVSRLLGRGISWKGRQV